MSMTKRERIIATLNHVETDIVPYGIGLTADAKQSVALHLGDDGFEANIANFFGGTGYNIVWEGVEEGKYPLSGPDFNSYPFPVIPEAEVRALCEKYFSEKHDEVFTTAGGAGPLFDRAWSLTGLENLLVYMIEEPEITHALLEKITEANLCLINIFLDYDFDGLYFGDDWGQQIGMIMGPGHWREFIKPYLAKMYGAVKKRGKYIVQHSCGDILPIFPDLIELGLDCYQTFQPEIYNLREVKEQYGDKLTFWGGIGLQHTLAFETPARVAEIARETMEIMGKDGGFIASPTHMVTGDIPAQNIVALLNVFQNQNKNIEITGDRLIV